MSSDPSWPPRGDVEYGRGPDLTVSPEDRNWAMAAHLGSLPTAWFAFGFIAPLLVLLARGGSSPFLRQHAVESLNFQINAFVYGITFAVLLFLLVGFLLAPLALAYVVFYLVCIVVASRRATSGRPFRYPLTFRVVS